MLKIVFNTIHIKKVIYDASRIIIRIKLRKICYNPQKKNIYIYFPAAFSECGKTLQQAIKTMKPEATCNKPNTLRII